jgi:hypothetical protein
VQCGHGASYQARIQSKVSIDYVLFIHYRVLEPVVKSSLRSSARPSAQASEEITAISQNNLTGEESSLLSGDDEGPGDIDEEALDVKLSRSIERLHRPDISGFNLLPKPDFWLLFTLLGILTGIGLMTINNIGNDVS